MLRVWHRCKRHARAAKRFLLAALVLGGALLGAGCVWVAMPIDPAPYLACSASTELVDRRGRPLFAFLNAEEQWCLVREADAFSPYLAEATIAAEDQRFYAHHGVDAVAVVRAALQNLRGGGIESGASTITMQLVKMTDDLPRSVWGKAVQAQRALRLERAASKEAILTAYLNKAPYGMNLVGVEAAALRYFGKPALEVTRDEAALLAGLPKSPSRLAPIANPERAKSRRDWILMRMEAEGFLSPEQREQFAARPLAVEWHDFPKAAPHLAMRLRAVPELSGRVGLTLDGAAQSDAEARLSRYLKQYDGAVRNGAILAVDVAAASVLVRVGGADFDADPGGQVDLCTAPRSPGSALKPFAYAEAMAAQQLYPSEFLLDGAVDYGDYAPANFSGEFHGVVTAGEALHYSLNVPAVTILERIGPAALRNGLAEAGITTLVQTPERYGLGLVLGNAGVRLDELCAAYAALARGGQYTPIRVLAEVPRAPLRRILPEGVAAAVFDMLAQPLPRETVTGYVQAKGDVAAAAWKTGTSTGNHDAWAFVYNAHYVVGVWLGNSDGTPSKRLVGADAALPLAAAVFRGLPEKQGAATPGAVDALKEIDVCAATGLPVSPGCGATESTLIPREQYLHRRCAVHAQAKVAGWPGDANGWDLAERHKGAAEAAGAQGVVLRIVSPAASAEYVMTGLPKGDRIALRAGEGVAERLHWYIDGRYAGASEAGTPLMWNLVPGEHEVSCMADSGAVDSIRFAVLRKEEGGRLEGG